MITSKYLSRFGIVALLFMAILTVFVALNIYNLRSVLAQESSNLDEEAEVRREDITKIQVDTLIGEEVVYRRCRSLEFNVAKASLYRFDIVAPEELSINLHRVVRTDKTYNALLEKNVHDMFEIVLPPGTYRLSFCAPDKRAGPSIIYAFNVKVVPAAYKQLP